MRVGVKSPTRIIKVFKYKNRHDLLLLINNDDGHQITRISADVNDKNFNNEDVYRHFRNFGELD